MENTTTQNTIVRLDLMTEDDLIYALQQFDPHYLLNCVVVAIDKFEIIEYLENLRDTPGLLHKRKVCKEGTTDALMIMHQVYDKVEQLRIQDSKL